MRQQFEIETQGPRTFRLSGELDISNSEHVSEVLVEALRAEGDLTLDISALTFVDSSGIRTLVQAARELEGRGRLILRDPQVPVLRVIELMGLRRLPNLEIVDPRQDPQTSPG
jgi:anti-sigma B factor antagonist